MGAPQTALRTSVHPLMSISAMSGLVAERLGGKEGRDCPANSEKNNFTPHSCVASLPQAPVRHHVGTKHGTI